MDLNEIKAHLEIRQVLYRYCRGVDRGDVELLKSVYHPDAIDHHGPFVGPGFEFAPWVVGEIGKLKLPEQHHITNVLIEVEGDVARVESAYLALHPEGPAENDTFVLVSGRYLDHFELRGEHWKIAERHVTIDSARPLYPADQWEGQAAFLQPAFDKNDPSYQLFGEKRPTSSTRQNRSLDAAERLLAYEDIRQAVARYARGIDRCDVELMKSAFHPGAIQGFGGYNGDAAAFCEMIVPDTAAKFLSTMHCNMNHAIDIEENGTVAHGEVYNTTTMLRAEVGGSRTIETWFGRYLDRYENRGGDWRIAHRVIVHELTQSKPFGPEMPIEGIELIRQGTADRGRNTKLGLGG